MSLRNKLKKTKPPEINLGDIEAPTWADFHYTGDDVPLAWDKKTLRQCAKNGLRENFKRGYFTKKQYKQQLGEL